VPYNIVVNSSCNLSCKYCFAKEILSNKDFISLDNINYIVAFLKNSEKKIVSLMGGEPTLHPQIISIIEKFRSEGFTISLKSNGLWDIKIKEYFSSLPENEFFILLNLNPPSTYTPKEIETLNNNLQNVRNQKLVLSINIDRTDFEYDYILKYATETNAKYIRWSFAHPIFEKTKKQISQTYFPITQYKSVSDRVVEFIKKANHLGIMTLGDHSVIRCMFNEKQYHEIIENNGEFNSKCEGSIDIFPDLQVIYCLPMYSLFEKHYLNEFENMDTLEMFFESRVNMLRKRELPFKECCECVYHLKNECHGGCLSHRIFSAELLDEFHMNWNYSNIKDKTIFIPSNVNLVQNNEQSFVFSDDFKIVVSDFVFDFLTKIKDTNSIDKAISEMDVDLNLYKCEINKLIENCQNYKILEIAYDE